MDEKYQRLKASTLRLSWLYYPLYTLSDTCMYLYYILYNIDITYVFHHWCGRHIYWQSMALLLELSFKCYQLVSEQVLGKGSFGKAYLVKNTEVPSIHMGIKPTPVALLFCVLKPQNYLRHWSYQNGVHWHKTHTDRWIPIPDWCNGEILGCNMITELPPKGPSCKMLNVLTCTYKILPIGFFWHSCISSTHDINVAVVSNCL